VFGEILGVLEGDVHTVEEAVHITMSHQFAKAVLDVLAKNIAAYEQQFGEIKIVDIDAFVQARQDSPEEPPQTASDKPG
jgi:Protein of unknown function (DUF3467)